MTVRSMGKVGVGIGLVESTSSAWNLLAECDIFDNTGIGEDVLVRGGSSVFGFPN
jgi:hypothetical protein